MAVTAMAGWVAFADARSDGKLGRVVMVAC
jgi:hypothetical protein